MSFLGALKREMLFIGSDRGYFLGKWKKGGNGETVSKWLELESEQIPESGGIFLSRLYKNYRKIRHRFTASFGGGKMAKRCVLSRFGSSFCFHHVLELLLFFVLLSHVSARSETIAVHGNPAEDFVSDTKYQIAKPETYSDMAGVFSFRGGPTRTNAATETANISKGQLKLMRGIRTGSFSFGSQAVIAKWYKNVRDIMNVKESKALKEVIVSSDNGTVYFFDLSTMEMTRDPLFIGVPMAVTPAINPYGYPLLYIGQSSEFMDDYQVNAGLRIYSLLDLKRVGFITSLNVVADEEEHAVFSSPIVDINSDTVIYTNGNGMLYLVRMNTQFDMKTVSISPDDVAMGNFAPIRSSVSMYGPYAYFADMDGVLRGYDLGRFQKIWEKTLEDSVVGAIPIERDGKSLYLYVGTVVNKTGRSRPVTLYKLNGSDGKELWSYTTEYRAKYSSRKENLAGVMASPLLDGGRIIFNVNRMEVKEGVYSAILYALDSRTGELVWQTILDAESVSSPIALAGYIVVGDESGFLHLIDGKNGKILDSVFLGSAVDASPAAYGNRVVVGTVDGLLFFVDVI